MRIIFKPSPYHSQIGQVMSLPIENYIVSREPAGLMFHPVSHGGRIYAAQFVNAENARIAFEMLTANQQYEFVGVVDVTEMQDMTEIYTGNET